MSDGPFLYYFGEPYEAYLASHQLEMEGCRTVVLDDGLSCYLSSQSVGIIRLMAFNPDEDRIGEPVESLDSFLDHVLRIAVITVCAAAAVAILLSLASGQYDTPGPYITSPLEIIVGLGLIMVAACLCGLVSARIYRQFREGDEFAGLIIYGVGWILVLMQGAFLVLPLLILWLLWPKSESNEKPPT